MDRLPKAIALGLCAVACGVSIVSGQRLDRPLSLRGLELLRGQLVAADGGPVSGMRAIVDYDGLADTIPLDSLGRFATLPRKPASAVVTLAVERTSDSVRYFPLRVELPAARLASILDVLLVPRVWRITDGRFAGREVPINVDAVVRRGSDRASFGRVHDRRLVGWTVGSFPVPLVLHHDGAVGLTTEDSVAFWRAVTSLDEILGDRLFVPVSDTLLRGTVYPVDVRVDPGVSAEAVTYVSWNSEGQIFEGSIRFRGPAQIRNDAVVAHELLHLLGFGHTAAWPSVLAARGGGPNTVTAEDAAYAQLLMRMHTLEVERGAVSRLGVNLLLPTR